LFIELDSIHMHSFLIILFSLVVLGGFILSLWMSSPSVKGKLGEAKIHNLLLQLPDEYYVFRDVVLKTGKGTTQIDHLVVSKYGIFAIETKNYRGEIIGNDNAIYWTQLIVTNVTYWKKWYKTYTYVTKNKLYNPVRQSQAHVYAIKNIIKKWSHVLVVPIVVFTDNAILDKVHSQDHVINDYQLLATIQSYRDVYLSNNDIEDILNLINVHDYREVISDQDHTRNVNRIKKEMDMKLSSGICPKCGGNLVRRNGKYGNFWGCSNYPKCKFTIN